MKGSCAVICVIVCLCLVLDAQETPSGEDQKPAGTAEDALLDDLPVVQAAALHQQTLEEAPANVSVITRTDILKYGYRTLGEALNSVRGFYSTSDRIYHYMGVSGISLPGDFNTRFLVMINGHSMVEHVYDSSNFFGQDFGLDMDLVERIEIIRGSGAALYGSNAMLATINVITRSPVDAGGLRVSTETGSFGEKKIQMSDSVYLGKGANLLISGSLFDNAGQTLFVPQFDSPVTSSGITAHNDGEEGYHTFANLVWGDWSFTAYFNTRRQQAPVNWASNTVFDDGGSHVRDGRNFVEAAHSQDIGSTGKLTYRFYYDDYRYDDRFDYYIPGGVEDQRSTARNEWMGSETTYSHPLTRFGNLLFGLQGEWEFRNLQTENNVSPVPAQVVRFNVPDRTVAAFTQQEWQLSKRWKVDAGLRFDRSHSYGNSLSPRLALVYQRSPTSVYKAVYGAPYRNPSAYEKFFNDGETVVSNPGLHAEHAHTFELSGEHKLGRRWTAIVDLYQYRIGSLIEEVFPGDDGYQSAVGQYQNEEHVRATGVELEISGKLPHELELLASSCFQRTIDTEGDPLPNSPRTLAKLRLGMPTLAHRAFLSSSAEYMSDRATNAGNQVQPVFLQDLTLSTRKPLTLGFDLEAGIRNVWNRQVEDPVGLTVDTLLQDGRSVFLKIVWQRRE